MGCHPELHRTRLDTRSAVRIPEQERDRHLRINFVRSVLGILGPFSVITALDLIRKSGQILVLLPFLPAAFPLRLRRETQISNSKFFSAFCCIRILPRPYFFGVLADIALFIVYSHHLANPVFCLFLSRLSPAFTQDSDLRRFSVSVHARVLLILRPLLLLIDAHASSCLRVIFCQLVQFFLCKPVIQPPNQRPVFILISRHHCIYRSALRDLVSVLIPHSAGPEHIRQFPCPRIHGKDIVHRISDPLPANAHTFVRRLLRQLSLDPPYIVA